MSQLKWILNAGFSLAILGGLSLDCPALELAFNGDFETGDFSDWTQFPTGPGQQTVTDVNPSSGTYAGEIFNDQSASNSLIKQANLGIGDVTPGETINISFDARGLLGIGGVAFAEVFSELSGGGTSKSEILGGGPLAIDADSEVWTTFEFSAILGPDVSGGVTLQLGATNGAVADQTSTMWYDNVSVATISALAGDTNGDGSINFQDLSPFVLALTDASGYQEAFPGLYPTSCDITDDGLCNFQDLSPFAALLEPDSGNNASSAVPEPSALVLCALACMLTAVQRRQTARTGTVA